MLLPQSPERALGLEMMRCPYTPIRMAEIKSRNNTKCQWGCRDWITFTLLIQKTKHATTIPPSNSMLGILSQRKENLCSHKLCTLVVIAALFVIIAPNWKKSRYSSMGEWLNKLIHLYHRILLRNQKAQMIDTQNNLDGSPENYIEWEKANPKMSPTVWFHLFIYSILFLKWQNYKMVERLVVSRKGVIRKRGKSCL